MTRSDIALAKVRREELAEFRIIFLLCFPLCLAAAALGRMLPRRWRDDRHRPAARRSIFAEAKAAAHACVPFAFMG